jgi:hypothetical protein
MQLYKRRSSTIYLHLKVNLSDAYDSVFALLVTLVYDKQSMCQKEFQYRENPGVLFGESWTSNQGQELVKSPCPPGVYTATVDSARIRSHQLPVRRAYRAGLDSLIGFGRLEDVFCEEIDILLNAVLVQVSHDILDSLGLGNFVKVPGSVFTEQLR